MDSNRNRQCRIMFVYHHLGRLVSESAFEREDPGSNPAADMVDAARNTAWDLASQSSSSPEPTSQLTHRATTASDTASAAVSISTYYPGQARSSDAFSISVLDEEIAKGFPELTTFTPTRLQMVVNPVETRTERSLPPENNVENTERRTYRRSTQVRRYSKRSENESNTKYGLFFGFDSSKSEKITTSVVPAFRALPVVDEKITDDNSTVKATTPSIESLMPSKIIPSLPPHLRGLTTTTALPAIFFNNSFISNVTAQLGQSVFLPCRTRHSSDRKFIPQVSWVRRRDWHILTSGTVTYTKEQRYDVHHPEGSTEWTLVIKYVKQEDAGTYECQLMSGGGLVSHLVHLRVVVPQAVIPGNGEYHVDTGSTIALSCIVEQSPTAPRYIFWYHNSRMINYDQQRGGINVEIDTEPRVRSRLTISDARPSDSGNYTCDADNTAPDSITVYITAGNKIAAIQPRDLDGATTSHASQWLFLSLAALLVFHQHLHDFWLDLIPGGYHGRSTDEWKQRWIPDFRSRGTMVALQPECIDPQRKSMQEFTQRAK
ncbi:Immunoglobulin V-set domain [Trinorchestia longiramus]|nr:Immunoglobulin V-set domain [Trinorchestia longiramus]